MTESVRPSRRIRVSARAGAAAAVLALAVTGCSSGAGNADPDTGAPASTPSATADAPPTSPGPASPTDTSTASPQPTSTAFVPASSEGPAQNVPVPEMPEAAREQTQEGLEAALEYWWETEHYLKITGDSAPLSAVSTLDCALCEELIQTWPAVYEANGWADTGEAKVEIAFSSLDNNGSGGRAILLISEAPGEVYRSDGSKVTSASGDGSENAGWGAGAKFSESESHWQIEAMGLQ